MSNRLILHAIVIISVYICLYTQFILIRIDLFYLYTGNGAHVQYRKPASNEESVQYIQHQSFCGSEWVNLKLCKPSGKPPY